jgi:hypothetical protein
VAGSRPTPSRDSPLADPQGGEKPRRERAESPFLLSLEIGSELCRESVSQVSNPGLLCIAFCSPPGERGGPNEFSGPPSALRPLAIPRPCTLSIAQRGFKIRLDHGSGLEKFEALPSLPG